MAWPAGPRSPAGRLLVCLALVWSGCGPASDTPPVSDEVLLSVGERRIGLDEFEDTLKELSWDGREALERQGPGGHRVLLERLERQLLLAAAARDAGFEADSLIERRVQRAQEATLAESYYSRVILPRIVSDEEVESFYRSQPDRFWLPALRRVATITLLADQRGGSEEPLEAKVARVASRLEQGADFAELAAELSEDEAALEGGERGWLELALRSPAWVKRAFELEPGQRDQLVDEYGTTVFVMVLDALPAGRLPLGSVSEDIRRALAGDRTELLEAELELTLHELQRRHPVVRNPQGLRPVSQRQP